MKCKKCVSVCVCSSRPIDGHSEGGDNANEKYLYWCQSKRTGESNWRRVRRGVNFRMMAKIIALIGYDLSFFWEFSLHVSVSTRCWLVLVTAFNTITHAQFIFGQGPNIFIASAYLCEWMDLNGMNELGNSMRRYCTRTFIGRITMKSLFEWNECNGRDECIKCHIFAWLDLTIIYFGLNWWIVCRRRIIKIDIKHQARHF